MSAVDELLSSDLVHRGGWTLFHSLWQFAIILALVALILQCIRSAAIRYGVLCIGMLAMLAATFVTFYLVPEPVKHEPDQIGGTQSIDHDRMAFANRAPRADAIFDSQPTIEKAEDHSYEPRVELLGDSHVDRPPVLIEIQQHESRATPSVIEESDATLSLALAPGYDGRQIDQVPPDSTNEAISFPSLVASEPSIRNPHSVEAIEQPSHTESELQQSNLLTACVPWMSLVWICGVATLLVWHLGGWLGVVRLRRIGTTPASEMIVNRVAALSSRMGISRSAQLLQSALVSVPVLIGWIRPVILLPLGLATNLTPSQLDAILAHELAHLRRHDYLVNMLQTLVETLFFYHPGVWWLSRRIRVEREHCCDDVAVSVCGSNFTFVEALTELEIRRAGPGFAMAAAGTRKKGDTMNRIRRLLGEPTEDVGGARGFVSALLAVLLLAGTITCFAVASDPAPVEAEPAQSSEDTPDADVEVPFPEEDKPNGLVLWNTFDSKKAIYNSRVGPGAVYRGEGGEFVEGVTSNALRLNHDDYEAVAFPKEVVPVDAGCIEFWAKLTDMPEVLHAGQRPALIQIFDRKTAFGIHFNGNDGFSNGGLCGWAGKGGYCGTGSFGRWQYESVLGKGNVDGWHHYALVWDKNGLGRSTIDKGRYSPNRVDDAVKDKTFAVYLDGKLNTSSWRGGTPRFPPLTGGELKLNVKHVALGQGTIAYDELKIWNYARRPVLAASTQADNGVARKKASHHSVMYDASRGTLPGDQGFRLRDTHLANAEPRIEKSVLQIGPTTTSGYQTWNTKAVPLDFRAEAAGGLSAEWIVRVHQSGTWHEGDGRHYTGWNAAFIDRYGRKFVIALAEDQVAIQAYPDKKPAIAKFNTTDAFHHYRFVVDDDQGTLSIDGKHVLSRVLGKPVMPEDRANHVFFGDATQRAGGHVELKAFYYSNDPIAKSPFYPAVRPTRGALEVDAAAQVRLQHGLVGHWPLDGHTRDSSGRGHHGRDWSKFTTDRFGVPHSAFAGDRGSLVFPDHEELEVDESFTVAAWIRPTEFSRHGNNIIKKWYSSDVSGEWGFHVRGGKLQLNAANYDRGSVYEKLYTDAGVIKLNEWAHVVATFDRGRMTIYLDGEPIATMQSKVERTTTKKYRHDELRIGGGWQTGSASVYHFIGAIDDVYLYNRALSAREVAALRNVVPARSLSYDASRGTLPTAQGFRLIDSDPKNVPPRVAKGVLLQGPTTKSGLQNWQTKRIPLDFRPQGDGLGAEWIVRIVRSEIDKKWHHSGWIASFADHHGHRFLIGLTQDQIVLLNAGSDPKPEVAKFNTTDAYHHYRFTVEDNQGTLFVDGNRLLSKPLGRRNSPERNANRVWFGDGISFGASQTELKAFYYSNEPLAKSPFYPAPKPATSLFYDAGRGTLPHAQGFALIDDESGHGTVCVEHGVLVDGPTTTKGARYWQSRDIPLDFRPQGKGLSAEWKIQVVDSVVDSTGHYSGWSASFVDGYGQQFLIGLGNKRIVLHNMTRDPNPAEAQFNTTDSVHHFRFVVDDNQGTLYVDGNRLLSKPNGKPDKRKILVNRVLFGDGTGHAGAHTKLMGFGYSANARAASPFPASLLYDASHGTLPTEQGFQLFDTDSGNASVHVKEGVLHQGPTTTIGKQFWHTNRVPLDFLSGGINAEWTARVVKMKQNSVYTGWKAKFADQRHHMFWVSLAEKQVAVFTNFDQQPAVAEFDTTDAFHHYRFVVDDRQGTLLIDGVPILVKPLGQPYADRKPNEVHFGDSSRHAGGHVELKTFYYSNDARAKSPFYPKPASLTDGLIAHYPFDEDFKDHSGNGNHGEPHNGPTFLKGVVGAAAKFDGKDDFVEVIPKSDVSKIGDFSIAVWTYVANWNGPERDRQYIFNGTTNSPKSRASQWYAPGFCAVYDLTPRGAEIHNAIHVQSGRNWDWEQRIPTKLKGRWRHMVFIRKGDQDMTFLDGQRQKSAYAYRRRHARTLDMRHPWYIGTAAGNDPSYFRRLRVVKTNYSFRGQLDDMRIYSRALSPQEIQLLYELGDDSHTLALHFDASRGTLPTEQGFRLVNDDSSNPKARVERGALHQGLTTKNGKQYWLANKIPLNFRADGECTGLSAEWVARVVKSNVSYVGDGRQTTGWYAVFIDRHGHKFVVSLAGHQVSLGRYPDKKPAILKFNTTDAFHHYRLVVDDEKATLLIDGREVLSRPLGTPVIPKSRANEVFFGDRTSNAGSQTELKAFYCSNDPRAKSPFHPRRVVLQSRASDVTNDSAQQSQATEPVKTLDKETKKALVVEYWIDKECDGELLLDSSGNELHGKLHGAKFETVAGRSAHTFDGKDDWIDCGKDKRFSITSEITLEAMVRPLGGTWRVVSKSNHNYSSGNYELMANTDGTMWFSYWDGAALGGNNYRVRARPPDDGWFHIIAAYNYKTHEMRFHVNGEMLAGEWVGRKPAGPTPRTPPTKLTLGAFECSFPDPRFKVGQRYGNFAGQMALVRIFDRALSETEVKNLGWPRQPRRSTHHYDASQGTLPTEQGFYRNSADGSIPQVRAGVFDTGTASTAGYSSWTAFTSPLDFKPSGKSGVAVEWSARIKSSETWYSELGRRRTGFGVRVAGRHRREFWIYLGEDTIWLQNHTTDDKPAVYKLDTTDRFHHYRFVVDDRLGMLFVDDQAEPVMTREVGNPNKENSSESRIDFGDLTSSAGGDALVKNFWYSTDVREKSPFHPDSRVAPATASGEPIQETSARGVDTDGTPRVPATTEITCQPIIKNRCEKIVGHIGINDEIGHAVLAEIEFVDLTLRDRAREIQVSVEAHALRVELDPEQVYTFKLHHEWIGRYGRRWTIVEISQNGKPVFPQPQNINDSLLLHYTFDNPRTDGIEPDESDHGNNATINGASWRKDGLIGGAMAFDGKNDFLDCGNDKSLNFGTEDFTVAVWFKTRLKDKLPHPYSYNPFVYKGNAGSHRPARPGYGLYATTEHGKAILRWDFGQRGPEARARVITDQWEADRWNHTVLVRRGKAIEAWLNGRRVTKQVQKATTDALVSCPEHLFVGKCVQNRDVENLYRGLLDDVRIYNRALSEQEIGTLVAMGEIGSAKTAAQKGPASNDFGDAEADGVVTAQPVTDRYLCEILFRRGDVLFLGQIELPRRDPKNHTIAAVGFDNNKVAHAPPDPGYARIQRINKEIVVDGEQVRNVPLALRTHYFGAGLGPQKKSFEIRVTDLGTSGQLPPRDGKATYVCWAGVNPYYPLEAAVFRVQRVTTEVKPLRDDYKHWLQRTTAIRKEILAGREWLKQEPHWRLPVVAVVLRDKELLDQFRRDIREAVLQRELPREELRPAIDAIDVLLVVGSQQDLPLLKQVAEHPQTGRQLIYPMTEIAERFGLPASAPVIEALLLRRGMASDTPRLKRLRALDDSIAKRLRVDESIVRLMQLIQADPAELGMELCEDRLLTLETERTEQETNRLKTFVKNRSGTWYFRTDAARQNGLKELKRLLTRADDQP
jgi:beta-lactamase regulating signal transducer with metallopeptidase domain